MVSASDVWNFVTGAMSLVPCILAYVYHQLPSNLFRVMDDTLKETESLLSSSLEDGLILDTNSTFKFMQSVEKYVVLSVFLSCPGSLTPS